MAFNPKTEYTIVQDQFAIEDFHKYKEDFITRPAYQRKSVWGRGKKQALMDSLFRRYYVPKLVIREVRISDSQILKEVIDGQQRITTVQDFFDNKFKLPKSLLDVSPDLVGKFYSDLGTDVRKFIDKELKYQADIIKNIEDPKNVDHQIIATDIFWRLQQGETLNYMEIAHAQLSSLTRNFIVKYSDDQTFDFVKYTPVDNNPNKKPFFSILNVDNTRMKYLQFLARFILIEKGRGYADLSDKKIVSLINDYKKSDGIGNYSFENEPEAKAALRNLNVFYDIFKDDPMLDDNNGIKELSVEYFIISIYMLIRHLAGHYVLDDAMKNQIREFVYYFHNRWKTFDDASDTDMLSFSNSRQQGENDLQLRDRILRKIFFAYLKDNGLEIIARDTKRAYSETERILIYRRDKGLCQKCLEEGKPEPEAKVSWSNYQADHVIPHSLGGETSLENAQVLCSPHNQSKGNRI